MDWSARIASRRIGRMVPLLILDERMKNSSSLVACSLNSTSCSSAPKKTRRGRLTAAESSATDVLVTNR